MWAVLFFLAVACGTQPTRPEALRVVSTPAPTGDASVTVDLPTSTPTDEPASRPPAPRPTVATPAPTQKPVAVAPVVPAVGLTAFSGLGSWIDVFDHDDDPGSVVPLVKAAAKRGVRTLYLESARYTSATDIQFPHAFGAAIDEAKAHGMRVVGWYPPGFVDVGMEVRRSLAAIRFVSPKGNRIDGFGADIEYTEAVRDHGVRSKRAVDYSNRLRAAVGASYPMGAIVIPPTSLEANAQRWPDFPWTSLAKSYQLFMPMNYWTAHGKDPQTASDLTKRNIEKTRSLTGKPVHIIGGLGESADVDQVAAYVKAAREGGSLGGGLYDYTTTRSDVWGELLKLNG
jgi:hypothetical protein